MVSTPSPANQATMLSLLGAPRNSYSQTCQPVTNTPAGNIAATTDGTTTWRYERALGSPVINGFGAIQA